MLHIESTPEHHLDEYAGQLGAGILPYLYLAVNYNGMMLGVAPVKESPGPDKILEIGTRAVMPDAVGNFFSEESFTMYTPVKSPRPSATGDAVALSQPLSVLVVQVIDVLGLGVYLSLL
ncbi:hypothetical protein FE257_005844 [Aspergillus nanangensis]|uniref:Uncharacterized protein n=1 Tax=Aspergillus nanangensis TaxID=2582783 RepID=A0AAD4CPT4_ASPNN|nr:hypothetical protein FE257_005844 [Aspergillus nanangensis]